MNDPNTIAICAIIAIVTLCIHVSVVVALVIGYKIKTDAKAKTASGDDELKLHKPNDGSWEP